jgi:hypothetical protein
LAEISLSVGGGKCGLFISSIENLCREANKPLTKIDYAGLNLEASLKKLSSQILKLITAKRSVELHRLAIGEAVNCPEVGEVWYTHGVAKTASFIRSLLESRREELLKTTIPIDRIAVILHNSLTGDILYRRWQESVSMKTMPSSSDWLAPRSTLFSGPPIAMCPKGSQSRFGAQSLKP